MVGASPLRNLAARSILETAPRGTVPGPAPHTVVWATGPGAAREVQRIALPSHPSAGLDPATVLNVYDYTV